MRPDIKFASPRRGRQTAFAYTPLCAFPPLRLCVYPRSYLRTFAFFPAFTSPNKNFPLKTHFEVGPSFSLNESEVGFGGFVVGFAGLEAGFGGSNPPQGEFNSLSAA